MVKRKRISNGEKSEGESIPDPPLSLVRLLQKDKEVLNYFTALQRNLSNDVKRWKDKALEYKKQVEEFGGITSNKKATETRKERKGVTKSRRKNDKKENDQMPPLTTVQIHQGKEVVHPQQDIEAFQTKSTKVRRDDSSLSEDMKDDESLDSLLKEEVAAMKRKPHNIEEKLKVNPQRSMLNDEDSSSSGFSELARELNEQLESNDGPSLTTIHTNSDVNNDERTKKEIMDSIYEAYESLRYCGISLVDVSPIEQQGSQQTSTFDKAQVESTTPRTEGNNSDQYSNGDGYLALIENLENTENGDESATMYDKQIRNQIKLTRRSDEDVVQNIFTCLRTLIRAPTLRENIGFECDPIAQAWYQPFMSRNFIPACYEVDLNNSPVDVQEEKIDYQHPLVKGLEMIIKSLIIMDTYHAEILAKEEEFEKILQYSSYDADTTRHIKEGMLNRNISSLILQSLEGELISNWGRVDRTMRSSIATSNVASDYQDSASDDESVKHEITPFHDSFRFSSKLQNRMFLLLERICLARIVSRLLHHHRDDQRLFGLLVDYLISNVPSRALEDYPRYAPTMSMCIVEALTYVKEDHESFLIPYCMEKFSGDHFQNIFCQTVLCAHAIWKERTRSSDRKVREWAMIEDAAFVRIRKRFNDWFVIAEMPETNIVAHEMMNEVYDINSPLDVASSCISIHLSLLLRENIESEQEFCGKIMAMIQEHAKSGQHSFVDYLSHIYTSSFNAVISLHERAWDAICVKGISVNHVKHLSRHDIYLDSHLDEIWNLIRSDSLQSSESCATLKVLIILLLRMCMIAGNGDRSYKITNWLFVHQNIVQLDRTLYKTLALMSSYPIVRVINLRSRQDRWKQIVTQSRQAQLLIVPAIACEKNNGSVRGSSTRTEELWGENAICGKDIDHIDFENQISCWLPSGKGIKQYVSSHWRPSDLKTFDSNAPQHDNLVRISVSERACAFSHIFSWIGVKNSLESFDSSDRDRLLPFKIAGYAQGPPLLVENEGMDPMPVCIILEDDAVLVDEFRDKLEKILFELPRDFHFCSLGYSRPKNAPMIHFSQRLGLPTCLWYLTGYILSLDGAEFLLNSLPCIGPVDSWVGLKIVSNWENDYGHRIGVGKVKASNDMSLLPKRKQLGDIIKFRAFAALSPLCSQKVAWRNSTSENAPRWRERDTDITYSGHK